MTSGPDVPNKKRTLMSPSICHRYTLDVHCTRKLVFYKPFRPKSKSNAVHTILYSARIANENTSYATCTSSWFKLKGHANARYRIIRLYEYPYELLTALDDKTHYQVIVYWYLVSVKWQIRILLFRDKRILKKYPHKRNCSQSVI